MSIEDKRRHFNDGVQQTQNAVIRALAGSDFRVMPWQAIRDLIREVARGTKLPDKGTKT